MLTLTRARVARGAAGEPLPTVFESLASQSIDIRRGQLTLVAAGPGVGKSVLALTLALRMGSPGYYFSADTDVWTMFLRAGAMLTGWATSDIETAANAGNTQSIDVLLQAHQHVRFDFEGRLEPDGFEAELKAYAMTYGEWPHFIIVDNLKNLDVGVAGEDHVRLEAACEYLHEMARTTGAAVIALHHVMGSYEDGCTPVPLPGLRGKISKTPEVVLTAYRDQAMTTMFVCPVKNRNGRADASAGWSIPLRYDPSRMQLEDIKYGQN